MKELFRTTLRLYAENPAHQNAWRLLKQIHETRQLPYADIIAEAVNGYFGQNAAPGFTECQCEEIREIVRQEFMQTVIGNILQDRQANQRTDQNKPEAKCIEDVKCIEDADLDTLLDLMGS